MLDRDTNVLWGDHLSNLLMATDGSGFNSLPYDPWTGYSRTAGLGYTGAGLDYVDDFEAMETGLIAPGGIPALDAQLVRRSPYYGEAITPDDFNATQYKCP
ncbi:MAG: hypothetical protein Q9P01_02180 [Anaerolineae bacterium]|nr:hypothetical protein [Anaerolineae bacterium]